MRIDCYVCKKKKKNTYRLFEEVQWHKYFADDTITELTTSSFLEKQKMKNIETYMLGKTQVRHK